MNELKNCRNYQIPVYCQFSFFLISPLNVVTFVFSLENQRLNLENKVESVRVSLVGKLYNSSFKWSNNCMTNTIVLCKFKTA